MRAILIEPRDRSIKEINLIDHSQNIRLMLRQGNGFDNGPCFVRVSRHDQLAVDDMGMLQEGVPVFRLVATDKSYLQLAGTGLIIGLNGIGITISTSFTLDEVKKAVQWTDQESTGKLTEPTTEIEGSHFSVSLGAPILREKPCNPGTDGKNQA